MIDRYAFGEACAGYAARNRKFAERLSTLPRLIDLAGNCYHATNHTTWEVLDRLEPNAQAIYFALVSKYESPQCAANLSADYARIQDPAGVTIRVENSDDDPFMVNFHISDSGDSGEGIADAWADCHGALMGGTWEACDGPDFVYDCGCWYPCCFDELKEYDLDFSVYSEPDGDDFVIAKHAGDCPKCTGDFRQAEKHMADGPLFSETYKHDGKVHGV